MTREEAIRHLDTYSSTNGSGQTTDEQHKEAKRMAVEALEKCSEYEQTILNLSKCSTFHRWIPVSEKLPEAPKAGLAEEYIVMIEGSQMPTTLYWDGNIWEDEQDNTYSVIAWMKLPDPYKEAAAVLEAGIYKSEAYSQGFKDGAKWAVDGCSKRLRATMKLMFPGG